MQSGSGRRATGSALRSRGHVRPAIMIFRDALSAMRIMAVRGTNRVGRIAWDESRGERLEADAEAARDEHRLATLERRERLAQDAGVGACLNRTGGSDVSDAAAVPCARHCSRSARSITGRTSAYRAPTSMREQMIRDHTAVHIMLLHGSFLPVRRNVVIILDPE